MYLLIFVPVHQLSCLALLRVKLDEAFMTVLHYSYTQSDSALRISYTKSLLCLNNIYYFHLPALQLEGTGRHLLTPTMFTPSKPHKSKQH